MTFGFTRLIQFIGCSPYPLHGTSAINYRSLSYIYSALLQWKKKINACHTISLHHLQTKNEFLCNKKNEFPIKILLRIFVVIHHNDCHEKKLYFSFCNHLITKHILTDPLLYSLVWT